MADGSIEDTVKSFILNEFLPSENPDALTEETPLFSEGVLDSLASLKLVAFLEETFNVTIEPHEVDAEYLDTLTRISELVLGKLATE